MEIKLKKSGVLIAILAFMTGCAQISAVNQQLSNWAGEQIKIRDADKQAFSDTISSKRDIDTLYVRIKREFGFASVEESMKGCNSKLNSTCAWQEMAIREDGVIHETVPGVYYRMARSFTNSSNQSQPFFLDITLEKDGKNVAIYYKARGNQAFADDTKTRLVKAIK